MTKRLDGGASANQMKEGRLFVIPFSWRGKREEAKEIVEKTEVIEVITRGSTFWINLKENLAMFIKNHVFSYLLEVPNDQKMLIRIGPQTTKQS